VTLYRLIEGVPRAAGTATERHRRSTHATDLRVAVLCARFNDFIVDELLEGALAAWRRHGGDDANLSVARVPGAFELPLAAKQFAATGRFDLVVALGCVIRGDTPHFDYVAGEAARGIAQAAYDTGVPVAFGVLTVETVEQARERSALARLDKGGEALESALEMALLLRQL
jgi:6,7-dimethyl-8-ribityllumazine synthase